MELLYGSYVFSCTFESDGILPCYKGSTFRGAFGQALKSVVCALKKEKCSECILNEKCLYAHFFEIPPNSVSPSPHPFVIEPPLTNQTFFPKGSNFSFNLILLGKTNHNLPYFIYAFEQMGKRGIGKRVKGKRAAFKLNQVTHKDQVIYSDSDNKFARPESLECIVCPDKISHSLDVSRVKVTFITPFRTQFKNKLYGDVKFHILARAMLRRISTVFKLFGEKEPELDYKGIIDRANGVEIVDNKTKWTEWRRYSSRQNTGMFMGGVSGEIIYSGCLEEFIPLLDMSSKLHIGKQTTFGLGKISYKAIE